MHLKFLSRLSRTLESANLMILIVAGVSGSGKTTVGAMLAGRLNWPFADADDFHPAANIEKMRSGIPLTDEDRQPWLRAIAAWMDERIAGDESVVMTCSALRRTYRDTLLDGRVESGWSSWPRIARSLAASGRRQAGSLLSGQLLSTQLDALEPPQPDENVITVNPGEESGRHGHGDHRGTVACRELL